MSGIRSDAVQDTFMFQLQWQKLYVGGRKLGNQRRKKERGTETKRMGKGEGVL
jgi:hypothetical protein